MRSTTSSGTSSRTNRCGACTPGLRADGVVCTMAGPSAPERKLGRQTGKAARQRPDVSNGVQMAAGATSVQPASVHARRCRTLVP